MMSSEEAPGVGLAEGFKKDLTFILFPALLGSNLLFSRRWIIGESRADGFHQLLHVLPTQPASLAIRLGQFLANGK